MSRKMCPIEVLQHYLDDLNSFGDANQRYEVRVSSSYFELVAFVKNENTGICECVGYYKSSDFETFCARVSYLSRKQVRNYMKGIQYPYKRKVGH